MQKTDERVRKIKEEALREATREKKDEPRDPLEMLERQLFNDDDP